jgi:hypothetical protein
MFPSQGIRDARNRYLYKLKQLHQLADILQIDPTLLAAYLHRLKKVSKKQEESASSKEQSL